MWKKIAPMTLVLVMLFSLTACGEEELPSAQEIVDAVIEAQDDIRTYEFEVDMTLDMSGEVEGEAVEMTLTMEFSGALDPDNREMRIDLSTDTDMEMPREPDEGELTMVTYLAGEVRMALYHVGGMRYAMMGAAEQKPMWTKYEASEADWEEMSEGIDLILQTEAQIGLLETAQVKVIGSEKVKGVDCYVLQLTPDMEQLWQLANQQPLLTDMGMFTAVGEDILQDMFRSFSVKQCVTKDTHFLIRTEVDMALDLTPEALGVEEGQMTMDVTISMLAYNHNQPVSIVLPPEAEEAIVTQEEEESLTEEGEKTVTEELTVAQSSESQSELTDELVAEEQQDSPIIPENEIVRPAESPWPMFHGTLRHTGLSPYDTSHVDGTEKWSFETGDGIESSSAIGADGTVYFGSHDGNLYAVNPEGTEKWRFYTGPPSYDVRWNVSKSIMASPAIASDGTIYIYSSANYLFAINPDGTEKWRFYVKWNNDFWSSPTIGPDGTIYIGSARSQEDPDFDGGLHAINPDGTEKWLFLDDSGVTSSAAIGADGTIYFGGNVMNPHGEGNIGKLYALYPDGTKKWEFTTENWMESSPAIGSDGTIYIGSGGEGKIYAINPDGTERWRFLVEVGVSAVPAIGSEGMIYIGAWDSNFYAINPDGTEKWRYKTPDAFEGVSSSAAIGADGTIYVGSNSGNFYAFNPDGTVKWNFETRGAGIVASPAIDWDGTIYFGSWNHRLYAIGFSLQDATDTGQGAISPLDTATTIPSEDHIPARPDPEYDYFTWTLPTGASPLRLSLPAEIEDIFYSNKTGLVGFGVHSGGHIEGLGHVWIELKPGTPVKSWADGVVEDIRYQGSPGEGEYHIRINYGYNLIGSHMEIMTPYVEVGDQVKRGEEIGIGCSFDLGQSSAEFALRDLGRTDGVGRPDEGVNVSPYDYLEDSEKIKLVEAYKEYVIEPYQQYGTTIGTTWVFEPYQPFLTNKQLLHPGNEGRLQGEWYLLSSKWAPEFPFDIMTFIEADNPYFKGNVALADDTGNEGRIKIKGTFEVDYEEGQLRIINEDGVRYFGIFEIDESEERARLKLELSTNSYPIEFGSEAATYIERGNLYHCHEDAYHLGVLDSP